MNLLLRTKFRTLGIILSASLDRLPMLNLGLHVKEMLEKYISNY